jgi:hypothetical protein
MNSTQQAKSSLKFRDILDEMKSKRLHDSGKTPLSLRGWLNYSELDLLNKQALALSRGCIRHVLYLVLHLGNYLNCHNEGLLNGLICEYREDFKKLIWNQLAPGRECSITKLQERLEPLNHLLHVIVERMKPSGPYSRREDEVTSLYPCPRHALPYSNVIHLHDIQFIRTIMTSRRKEEELPPLFTHLLFLMSMQGFVSPGAEGHTTRKNQEKYRDLLKEKLLKMLVTRADREKCAEGSARSRCALEGSSPLCFTTVFDVQADEWLIKIACAYRIHMLTMPEYMETNESNPGQNPARSHGRA